MVAACVEQHVGVPKRMASRTHLMEPLASRGFRVLSFLGAEALPARPGQDVDGGERGPGAGAPAREPLLAALRRPGEPVQHGGQAEAGPQGEGRAPQVTEPEGNSEFASKSGPVFSHGLVPRCMCGLKRAGGSLRQRLSRVPGAVRGSRLSTSADFDPSCCAGGLEVGFFWS